MCVQTNHGLADRREAGRLLAEQLHHHRQKLPMVVGLTPGGTIVAAEIAQTLDAPLDVMVVSPVEAPDVSEGEFGAIALGEVAFFEPRHVSSRGLSITDLQRLAAPVIADVKRKTRHLRGRATLPPVRGRTAVLVCDGVTTKATTLAALWALRRSCPTRVVIAIGVAPPSVIMRLREDADEVHCLLEPEPIGSVADWFGSFECAEDDDIVQLLAAHSRDRPPVRTRPMQKSWTSLLRKATPIPFD